LATLWIRLFIILCQKSEIFLLFSDFCHFYYFRDFFFEDLSVPHNIYVFWSQYCVQKYLVCIGPKLVSLLFILVGTQFNQISFTQKKISILIIIITLLSTLCYNMVQYIALFWTKFMLSEIKGTIAQLRAFTIIPGILTL